MSADPKSEFVGYPEALASLESPISRVLNLAQTLALLLEDAFPDCEGRQISDLHARSICFIGDELFRAADKLDDLWLEHHNKSPDDPLTAAIKLVAAANAKAKVPVVGEAK